jgi:hypothetical protein
MRSRILRELRFDCAGWKASRKGSNSRFRLASDCGNIEGVRLLIPLLRTVTYEQTREQAQESDFPPQVH